MPWRCATSCATAPRDPGTDEPGPEGPDIGGPHQHREEILPCRVSEFDLIAEHVVFRPAHALRLVILGWLDAQTLAFQLGCSGYFERMARSRLPDTASVPIVLRISISEDDVARIDQVLARPEFAEWSRSEWCLEIIRTALRYYVGDSASPEAEPAPAVPEARRAPAPDSAPPAIAPEPPLPDADEVAPEPPGRSDCSHPQDARDYQTGTCAACGAILWD